MIVVSLEPVHVSCKVHALQRNDRLKPFLYSFIYWELRESRERKNGAQRVNWIIKIQIRCKQASLVISSLLSFVPFRFIYRTFSSFSDILSLSSLSQLLTRNITSKTRCCTHDKTNQKKSDAMLRWATNWLEMLYVHLWSSPILRFSQSSFSFKVKTKCVVNRMCCSALYALHECVHQVETKISMTSKSTHDARTILWKTIFIPSQFAHHTDGVGRDAKFAVNWKSFVRLVGWLFQPILLWLMTKLATKLT